MDNSSHLGIFSLPSGKDIHGKLTFAREDTSLYLYDKNHFDTDAINGQCIKGVLHDLTKVTLVQCLSSPKLSSCGMGKERHYSTNIFPHFVIHGDCHIDPLDKKIRAVSFVIDDAAVLFYDFDAFGSLLFDECDSLIKQIVQTQESKLNRRITIGSHPVIFYFTGKDKIFETDTALGKVSASHCPKYTSPGPEGINLNNTIYSNIEFRDSVTLKDAIIHISKLRHYFSLLIGRPQNLLKLQLTIESDEDHPKVLQVYWSMPPKRETSDKSRKPHPSGVLLKVAKEPNEFSLVLRNWLKQEQNRSDAYSRFFGSLANQDKYDIDRLISVANMFDILPNTAVPPNIHLSEDMEDAKNNCRMIFKKLPQSPERNSILSALGRIGKSTLKHKIRYRNKLLTDKEAEHFPDLDFVTDEAVNCRNHYVHGSTTELDYRNNFDTVIFFTDTLEFVFAVSELIEAGWDVCSWCDSPSLHQFADYRDNYYKNLKMLYEAKNVGMLEN